MKLATVSKSSHDELVDGVDPTCTIRVLNKIDPVTVPASSLSPCTTPDPADIPILAKEIDPNAMNSPISKEDLDKLWHRDRVTFLEHLRMYLYWHQRLQHPSHVSMVRLAERGALPSAIKYTKKAPPCASCLFTKAQRRAWHNEGKQNGIIRKDHHTSPGKGALADHIISHQPGLILQ
eukprot:15333441-Ditylum_brightwellii.AAC.2